MSLPDALMATDLNALSPFGLVILTASLAGRNLIHLKHPVPEEHQAINDNLIAIGFALPDRLRLPIGLENPNVVFAQMMLLALTICLHQARAANASPNNFTRQVAQEAAESSERCLTSALAITSMMRLVNHTDFSSVRSSHFEFCCTF